VVGAGPGRAAGGVRGDLPSHRRRDADFDFLTWFEYAPRDAPVFEELVSRLRATPEWDYVERDIDIRLTQ
jgi:hypothetical protein